MLSQAVRHLTPHTRARAHTGMRACVHDGPRVCANKMHACAQQSKAAGEQQACPDLERAIFYYKLAYSNARQTLSVSSPPRESTMLPSLATHTLLHAVSGWCAVFASL